MIEERFRQRYVAFQGHDERDAAGTDAEYTPNYAQHAKVVNVRLHHVGRKVKMQTHLDKHAAQADEIVRE